MTCKGVSCLEFLMLRSALFSKNKKKISIDLLPYRKIEKMNTSSNLDIDRSATLDINQKAKYDDFQNENELRDIVVHHQKHDERILQYLSGLYEHDILSYKRLKIIVYIFVILLYIGVQIAMMILNGKPQEFIETHYWAAFHLVEFWAVFVFSTTEAFILFSSGSFEFTWGFFNVIQILILFTNIVLTLAAALILSTFHEFEKPAHYIEYTSQIIISSVNLLFIIKNFKKNKTIPRWETIYNKIYLVVAIAVILLSILNLMIYAEAFDVGMEAERAAHFCEFSNEIVNGLFALIFSIRLLRSVNNKMDNVYSKIKI
eukprot:TRINITY_DN4904_c0_g1_i1.p1 TRINITY_DN4904_c0_g1~~TRINITY_DN4904_c0_g1_i1.p1  ORF type:complete len:316 (+),score=57.57 TRINITY_DN4904_c0_g1_i1:388-1335(+)